MVLLCAGMVGKEMQHYVYDGNIDEELRADIHELPEKASSPARRRRGAVLRVNRG